MIRYGIIDYKIETIDIGNELLLTFDSSASANGMIGGDCTLVADWNTAFDSPVSPFTSVEVVDNVINLKGGSNITVPNSLFSTDWDGYGHLISIIDTLGCIVAAGDNAFSDWNNDTYGTILETAILPALVKIGWACFWWCPLLNNVNFNSVEAVGQESFDYLCGLSNLNFPALKDASADAFRRNPNLTSVNFPNAITLGNTCFGECSSLNSIYLPVCSSLGSTVGYDGIFSDIVDLSINLTIPAALMTCNGGDPDGDIQILTAPKQRNTVTIIQV